MPAFPKQTANMPDPSWKRALAFSPFSQKPVLEKLSKPARKPIKTIGKRTKERLAAHGSETELFARVWAENPHFCVVCGEPVFEPLAECFSHRLGKWRYPEFRYEPKNIGIVCANGKCHHKHDAMNKGRDAEIIESFRIPGKST